MSEKRTFGAGKNNKSVKLVQIEIPQGMLDVCIGYLIFIPKLDPQFVLTVQRLFKSIDPIVFQNNEQLEVRHKLILAATEIIIDRKIKNPTIFEETLYSYFDNNENEMNLLQGVIDKADQAVSEEYFTDSDLDSFYKYIEDRYTYTCLYEAAEEYEHIITAIRNESSKSIPELATRVREMSQKTIKDLRDTGDARKDKQNDFTLNKKEEFKKSVGRAIERARSPASVVYSGLKLHNKQLGGGYQAGRVYLYIGPSGGGKSMLHLNQMRWFITCNPNMVAYNPRLIPCALYVTLENDIDETHERNFAINVPKSVRGSKSLKDFSEDQVCDLYEQEGLFDGPSTFHIKYRRHRSINTADLEVMMDELEDEGYECRLLLLDYTKRIRPVHEVRDMRLDLGEVINDLSSIAKARRLPVITSAQMNGEGMKALEDAQDMDAVKKLTVGVVGESKLMIENVDYAFLFYNAYSASLKKTFWTCKKIKGRAKDTYREPFILHPYLDDEITRFDEDFLSVETKGFVNAGTALGDYDPNKPIDDGEGDDETEEGGSTASSAKRFAGGRNNKRRNRIVRNPVTETSEDDNPSVTETETGAAQVPASAVTDADIDAFSEEAPEPF